MILEDVLKEVLNRRKDRDSIWNAIQHNKFTYKGPIRDQLLFIEKMYSCNDKLMEEEVRDIIVSVFGEGELEEEEPEKEIPKKNTVTAESIKAKIKDVKYTVLEDGKTTIANVYLENGFTVRGESACVDPNNYNKEMGEEIAYSNAFEKIWELEGYLLAEKLYKEKV